MEYVDKVIHLYNLYSSSGNVIITGDFKANDTPKKHIRGRNNNTLFQEDNIFGMYASLTYGPQLQR